MISIVIPVYNEEKYIQQCLDSITQLQTKHEYEVVIVDNDSSDSTRTIVATYQKKLRLRIIVEKQRGRGAARSTGFTHAQGEVIFSTDADTIIPPHWIETMMSYFDSKKNVVAVTGLFKFTDCCHFLEKLMPFFLHVYKLLFGHYWLSGFNFAIKRDAYIQSKGFDRKLNAQEDTELGFRIVKIGNIMYAPDCYVKTSSRRFEKGMISTLVEYVVSFVNMKFRKESYLRNEGR
ncbi:hypothetical protein A3H80_01950 [Candidatus Roizmanbacteria bacterium RIFCSPLOWO2_02_FULL_37_19]|uniref:Glycosyltransferase 2-like domain-containing protein n=1 Tax=Candidatus Roizmanbacteria bacterium RIFCSPHIGHO2_02_FULL_37_24 TaxID=1802037 RepID=A0A1F7GVT7_9BACT|nr:MAG: hypothetical protein A2862_01130 [Candidatus Roizmanbacteria bacterium RIFCSPHIGHO2_01_FULL_38_41]OGK22706.1 MAG: hypothetical protein A3C24_02755 [Candidatus Roizmanbacteria bacterium RIFCSPHIGHO2_02_FULL_37_24]OGK32297.1 MAG: hypothetical protein A3E10_04805 [Candidatus Roizmanbacteria bacterium RIFCSPHIGHO2_12_FULL_37_23]OGK43593.1 MAG: hypothetical protein A2956_02195 [Candidatus Roizmanbacteria bacterium RIFCSPLOWO2_01_FULL_37_57]OGK54307.1 MAG: hypothetical protein A3H80_01950 [Ca